MKYRKILEKKKKYFFFFLTTTVAEPKASEEHVKAVLPPAPAPGQSTGYTNL